MLQFFVRFSGIFAIIAAWMLVIYPAIRFGINTRKETVSLATLKNEQVGKVVSFGLVVGTLFQIIFLFYFSQKFLLNYFSFGSLLYLTANSATIFVAFFTYKNYPTIHKFFVEYYFFAMPISLVFLVYHLKDTSAHILFSFSIFILILYFVGQLLLFLKHKESNSLMEAWAFAMLSAWTLVVTFFPGL
jgi:hypothetical protein